MKTILLLHGWNYNNYTNLTTSNDAWLNRINFVKQLEKIFKVYRINFPGFCGEKEPKKAWALEDYAKYVDDYIKNNNLNIDYIIGYSFGGAVAIKYNLMFNKTQKIILISPAIKRITVNSKKYINTPIIFNPIRNIIRDLYVTYIIKTNEMYYGTKFLRRTYQNIARVNLMDDYNKIDKGYVRIIFGKNDTMVDTNLNGDNIYFLDGGHDIANTNTAEIIEIIENLAK